MSTRSRRSSTLPKPESIALPVKSETKVEDKEEEDNDITERDDLRKTMLGILLSNNLKNLTAEKARRQLEDEMEEDFKSPVQKRKIRLLIKQLLYDNSNKFTKYASEKAKSPTKGASKRKASTRTAKKTATKKSPAKKRSPKQAKVFQVSDALRKIVKVEKGERSEISSLLWAYIREKELQNPENRKQIICDELLKDVCAGIETITSLQVTFHLNKNLSAIDEKKQAKKELSDKEEEEEEEVKKVVVAKKNTKVKSKTKKQKGNDSMDDDSESETEGDEEYDDFVQKK